MYYKGETNGHFLVNSTSGTFDGICVHRPRCYIRNCQIDDNYFDWRYLLFDL